MSEDVIESTGEDYLASSLSCEGVTCVVFKDEDSYRIHNVIDILT